MFEHNGRRSPANVYDPPMEKADYESGFDGHAGTRIEAIIFSLRDTKVRDRAVEMSSNIVNGRLKRRKM
jgi:hypothetical protein